MNTWPSTGRPLLALLLIVWLSGCAVKSPTPSYYSLSSIEPFQVNVHDMVRYEVAVGVGPVAVADYLKRTQVVTRLDDNRYGFSEFHRWAGLIEQDIVTVLGNNLGILLGTNKIASYPWLSHFNPDYRIVLEIIRFDAQLDSSAVISARWTITDSSGKKTLTNGQYDKEVVLNKPTYAALVEAESFLLAEMTRMLAAEIKKLI